MMSLTKQRFLTAITLSVITMLMGGCGTFRSFHGDRREAELSIQKLRADLEEVRHDMDSQKMELHVLEGKCSHQENTLSALKENNVDTQRDRITQLIKQLAQIEKMTGQLKEEQVKLSLQVEDLCSNASETNKALIQSKEKLYQIETLTEEQKALRQAIADLKKEIDLAMGTLSLDEQHHAEPLNPVK